MLEAYTDGACRGGNPGFCSCAFAVFNEDGSLFTSEGRYLGDYPQTNNYAEYQGLLDVLFWSYRTCRGPLHIYCDSMLVVQQVNGEWNINNPALLELRSTAYAMLVSGGHKLTHIKGHSGNLGNELVDQICNEVLDKEGH